MWASDAEKLEQFHATTVTLERYDFRIYDVFDNGEFFTSANVDLIDNGVVVATETFHGSSEFMDNDGTGEQQALSYAVAWVETRETPMEVAFAPFGPEWQREQDEDRRGW